MNLGRTFASERTRETVVAWTERMLGVPLSAWGVQETPVLAPQWEPAANDPLVAARADGASVIVATPELREAIRPAMRALSPDMLFSPFGVYELARRTLPLGVTTWGPSFYLFGDRESVAPADDSRVARVGAEELAAVDYGTFWHCSPDAVAGFMARERGEPAALATVTDSGAGVMEIGMETHPNAQGRGLGRAVVAAAADWIVSQGRVAHATVGTFNVPSARTLRGVGLRYAYMSLEARPGRFMVPPQTLGSPRHGETLYNYYPEWAMTKGILPRPGS